MNCKTLNIYYLLASSLYLLPKVNVFLLTKLQTHGYVYQVQSPLLSFKHSILFICFLILNKISISLLWILVNVIRSLTYNARTGPQQSIKNSLQKQVEIKVSFVCSSLFSTHRHVLESRPSQKASTATLLLSGFRLHGQKKVAEPRQGDLVH